MTDMPYDPEGPIDPSQLSEDELRAAYEAEMKRLRVEDVVAQTAVSLLNLGARKAGLVAGSEDERDLPQVRMAIEGARALLPLVEPQLGPNAAPLRDALSQLQLAYAQLAGEGQGERFRRRTGGGRARSGAARRGRRRPGSRSDLRAALGARPVAEPRAHPRPGPPTRWAPQRAPALQRPDRVPGAVVATLPRCSGRAATQRALFPCRHSPDRRCVT